jgi:cytochrome c nitrite reductase small subunit
MKPDQTKNIFLRFIRKFIPPQRWKFPVIILLGIFMGLGIYVVYISNAVSYLSDDPRTCVNCHVMYPQYATCNDCHVPHDNVIHKYLFKAQDGLRHAAIFTLRLEPQVIQIKDAGKIAVQSNCIRCHSNLVHPIGLRSINNNSVEDQTGRYCWSCHRETPHGRVNSLSSTPYANVPQLQTAIPDWLREFIETKK